MKSKFYFYLQANREKGKKLLAEGNKSGAVDMFQKAISITNDMVVEVNPDLLFIYYVILS